MPKTKPKRRAPVRKTSSSTAKAASGISMASLRSMFGGTPGSWASDHRAEAMRFTGWTYVGLRAVGIQAAQASVEAYDDGEEQEQAEKRRKSRFKARWERLRGVIKAVAETEQAEPLKESHPLAALLANPNPYQSGAIFRYESVIQLGLTGTRMVWNVPSKGGKTVARYIVPKCLTSAIHPRPGLPNGGYWIQASWFNQFGVVGDTSFLQGADSFGGALSAFQSVGVDVPAEQIQESRWPHPIARDDGYSALAAGAYIKDTAKAVDEARWAQLHHGADPSLLVRLKAADLDQLQLDALTVKLNQKYAGAANAGKMMILNAEDADIEKLSTSPKDMDYVAAFLQLRDAELALHGVPGIAAGISDGGSYAAFIAALRQFITLRVQPELDFLAEEETRWARQEWGASYCVEMEAMHVDDEDQVNKRIDTDVRAGAIKIDEVRAIRGLEPLENGAGEKIAGQQAMQPVLATASPLSSGVTMETAEGKPGKPSTAVPAAAGAAEDAAAAAAAQTQEIETAEANVLNGAQITAASAIVLAVANGQLPRDAGIGQLEVLVNLSHEQAERVMGSAGMGTPTTPNTNPVEDARQEREQERAEERLAAMNGDEGPPNGKAPKRFNWPPPAEPKTTLAVVDAQPTVIVTSAALRDVEEAVEKHVKPVEAALEVVRAGIAEAAEATLAATATAAESVKQAQPKPAMPKVIEGVKLVKDGGRTVAVRIIERQGEEMTEREVKVERE